jgi:hypothetical protein
MPSALALNLSDPLAYAIYMLCSISKSGGRGGGKLGVGGGVGGAGARRTAHRHRSQAQARGPTPATPPLTEHRQVLGGRHGQRIRSAAQPSLVPLALECLVLGA